MRDASHLKPYHWKKGQSGNPEGKKKGTISILAKIKDYLREHPEKMEQLVKYYVENEKMRELLWKMIDGSPRQQVDMETRTTVVQLDSDIAQKYNVTSSQTENNSEGHSSV